MKRITTTREYDDQGRLVRETTVTDYNTPAPVRPGAEYTVEYTACTCPLTYCPLHSARTVPSPISYGTVTLTSNNSGIYDNGRPLVPKPATEPAAMPQRRRYPFDDL